MAQIFLLLGSNQGNRLQYISSAEKLLIESLGASISESSIYATQPWGMNAASNGFYNKVLVLSSQLSPIQILDRVQSIENKLGRTRNEDVRFGDRTIDIDILFIDRQVISSDRLTVPHSLIAERRFVLVPLCEIIPGYVHPVFNKRLRVILEECADNLAVEKVLSHRSSS